MSVSGQCYAAGPDCDGPMQRHHLVKRARIRKVWRSLMAAKRRGGPNPWSVTKALADERNLVWVCQRHHLEETAMPVPAGFWDFVAEYDLAPALPRFLTEEQADRALERADSPLTHLDLRPQRPCHVCGEMAHEAEPGRWICHCGDWGQVA